MPAERTLLYFDGGRNTPSTLLRRFAERYGLILVPVGDPDEVVDRTNRSFPACLVLDAGPDPEATMALCARLKHDPFTSIVPVVILVPSQPQGLPTQGLTAGADEVLRDGISDRERLLRLDLLLRRAARDVSVHPTTRLPGTVQIERDMARRLEAGASFALCYADLDYFKEFNDRYGYGFGDGVILLTAMILRDIVRAMAPDGFVGHIGGDDFIFTVPLHRMEAVCGAIIDLFDELIPYQYASDDRTAGYFMGKDRRGTMHRVPLMTLSIGVVTSRAGQFDHTAQISERAADMKSYAKSLPGSIYVVDRRQPEPAPAPRPTEVARPPSGPGADEPT
jgi:diguanylate cyclase (GGDEF)-like protein